MTTICSVPKCGKTVKSKGMCSMHYERWRLYKDPNYDPKIRKFAERFWARVNKHSSGCWIWQGSHNELGYGLIRIDKKVYRAHRIAWELTHGTRIPKGKQVCHSCDNPSCVRPEHLWLGNMSSNILDCSMKGRHGQKRKTHCPKGHPYTGDNLIIRDGRRFCRICRDEYSRMYKRKLKAKRIMDVKRK